MRLNKIGGISAGVIAILLALVIVDELAPAAEVPKEAVVIKPIVSVVTAPPQNHSPNLTLLATSRARWPIQLKASSSAQLAWLNTAMEPGQQVTKGTPLAKLETSALELQLAQAKSEVMQAELNLKQQLHEQSVALTMLSAKKTAPFARKEPQVAAAKAELARAQIHVKNSHAPKSMLRTRKNSLKKRKSSLPLMPLFCVAK